MKSLKIRDLAPSKQIRGIPILSPLKDGWNNTSPIRPVLGWILPLDHFDSDFGENAFEPQQVVSTIISLSSIDEDIARLVALLEKASKEERERFARAIRD